MTAFMGISCFSLVDVRRWRKYVVLIECALEIFGPVYEIPSQPHVYTGKELRR
jgi:hypothetical protein